MGKGAETEVLGLTVQEGNEAKGQRRRRVGVGGAEEEGEGGGGGGGGGDREGKTREALVIQARGLNADLVAIRRHRQGEGGGGGARGSLFLTVCSSPKHKI